MIWRVNSNIPIASFGGAGAEPATQSSGVDLARSLNGSSDFINCGDSGILAPTAITIAAWVNPISLTPAISAIVSRSASGSVAYYQILLESSGHAGWYVLASSPRSVDPGSATISTSVWTHLAMSYDSTNGLGTYVNGVSDGTVSADGSLSTAFTTESLTIGEDTNVSGRLLSGAVADIALWNIALTPTQIVNLASGQRANTIGSNANLICYLPIIGQSPEPDKSGNSNNGVLTGTTVISGPPTLQPF